MAAAEYARRTGTPYFGICYGFQWMVTEYARNVCGLTDANSTEVDEHTPHKVIYKLQDLLGVEDLGRHHAPRGLRRASSSPAPWPRGSTARPGSSERHRHRYEFNKEYEGCLTPERPRRSRARPPTASSRRSPSCPAIPTTSRSSSTPSSSRSRCDPHPLFASFVKASLENRQARRGAARRPPVPSHGR